MTHTAVAPAPATSGSRRSPRLNIIIMYVLYIVLRVDYRNAAWNVRRRLR